MRERARPSAITPQIKPGIEVAGKVTQPISWSVSGVARAFRDLGFRTKYDSDESLALLGEAFLGFAVRNQRAFADADLIKHFNESLPPAMKANPIVELPGDILLVGRVMGLLSGVSKQLGSEVDVGAMLMPYLLGGGVPPAPASGVADV